MASRIRTPEFGAEAVRIALTSGLPRKQVATDLGVGFSTLNRWVQEDRRNPEKPTAQTDMERELAELRRENRLLREEREVLKKATYYPAGDYAVICREGSSLRNEANDGAAWQIFAKQMLRGFAFIAKNKGILPVNRLCQIMDVSPRGYRAFCSRPLSNNQCRDLVLLAHIREQFALSLGSYGRPRMTEELKEAGVDVGHRRVGRIMRENGIRVERSKKYKVTTDSNHTFNIAPNLLGGDFHATAQNQKWAGDISYIWTREGWLYLAVIIDLYSRRVVGWAVSNRMKRDPLVGR